VAGSTKPNRIGFGIASLILGILGLCSNLVTGFLGGGGIGMILVFGPEMLAGGPGLLAVCSLCCPVWVLLGIITGILGMNSSKGRGLAVAGLALSILALVIGICAMVAGGVIGPSPAPGGPVQVR